MERTMKVIGKGKLVLPPDLIQITIHLNITEKEYEQVIISAAKSKDELTSTLVNIGFNQEELKTNHFSVDSKYEGYSDEHGNWKNKFVGYELNHELLLSFQDFDLLGKALYALSTCSSEPQFSIHYTLKNQEKAKEELLTLAMEDAKKKAELLSRAANVSLMDIISIDYHFNELNMIVQPMERVMLAKSSMDTIPLDIHPNDLIIEDQVSVIWTIE